jgi:dihydrofolate synthase/folylpolyglutamate synthase
VRSFRLERMKALAEIAGHPELCAPAIHVAGSKGKGSTTTMLASILEAAGVPTGRYCSPHVSDWRERIGRGSGFFDDALYVRGGNEMRDIVESAAVRAHPLFDENNGGASPTYFEMMTLLFFLCCRDAGVKAMAVETGMGGRLDATNILSPLVSVITTIELEHTEYLGHTIAAISGEKAGIIKQGRPLILQAQRPEALAVFQQRCKEQEAELYYIPDRLAIDGISVDKEGVHFSLYTECDSSPGLNLEKLFVPMSGAIMAENAASAVLALLSQQGLNGGIQGIDEKAVRQGLAQSRIPARFETLAGNKTFGPSPTPAFIIDGAHTCDSVKLLVNTYERLYRAKRPVLLFGCAADKDAEGMAAILVPHFGRIFITRPGTFKTSFPEKLAQIFRSRSEGLPPDKRPQVTLITDTREAIDAAGRCARESGLPCLGTGSFYLAAEIRAMVR